MIALSRRLVIKKNSHTPRFAIIRLTLGENVRVIGRFHSFENNNNNMSKFFFFKKAKMWAQFDELKPIKNVIIIVFK